MHISDTKTIAQVQEEFSSEYPGLKLEFYKKSHKDHMGSLAKDQYGSDEFLSNIRQSQKEGELYIRPEMSVSALEAKFEEIYGLNVQVFRRSNKIWLQTSATDDWTLEVQNRKGVHSVQSN